MVTTHALSIVSRGKWIVDSGATCHMCNDREQFVDFVELFNIQKVTLGVLETGTLSMAQELEL